MSKFRARRPVALGVLFCCALARGARGQLPASSSEQAPRGDLLHGRQLLMARQFTAARQVFAAYLATHPGAVQAQLGLGDAQLGLHQYEAAELTYRAVTARQPELWQAHKNLVVVEAALHRWDEFDRERTLLRLARERGAPGISSRESDVIDSFDLLGQHWVVRAYFEPVGRSEARYNFEHFAPDGRVLAYLSLEDSAAAQAALRPGDVLIGGSRSASPANSTGVAALSLNWYTGRAHGTIHTFPAGEPRYQQLRAQAMAWIRQHPALISPPGFTGQGDVTAPKTER